MPDLPDDIEITGSLVVFAGDFQEPVQLLLDRSVVDALNVSNPLAWGAVIALVEREIDAQL